MRVTIFHVGDGDCVLLEAPMSDDNGDERQHRILVDGGRKTQFRKHARQTLADLEHIDLVCVSHIDDDHISGLLALIEDSVRWRVYNHLHEKYLEAKARADAAGTRPDRRKPRKPRFPEPPAIDEIWHNSLFELVGDELEPAIEASLANTAAALGGSGSTEFRSHAARCENLANGERSSMELSRRISDRQLGIPRNRPRNEVMALAKPGLRRVGPFTIRIIGPTVEAVAALEASWVAWLRANTGLLRRLQQEMLEDEERLADAVGTGAPAVANALGEGTITEPNLASLMLLVQERDGGPTVLLTGDGSSEDILEGLERQGRLDENGCAHVDVLKVQHHGAEANVTTDFVDRVTADHYLFCGNGAHHNPERAVVEAMIKARLGVDRPAVGPERPFTFWFSSSSKTPGLTDNRKRHMGKLEELVAKLAEDYDPDDRFTSTFLKEGSATIELQPDRSDT